MLACRVADLSVLPTLSIYMGSHLYQLQPQHYLHYCIRHFEYHFCDTYIEVGPNPNHSVVLGDAFFNRYYTVFDLDQRTVAIAPNKEQITIQDICAIKDPRKDFDPEDWDELI